MLAFQLRHLPRPLDAHDAHIRSVPFGVAVRAGTLAKKTAILSDVGLKIYARVRRKNEKTPFINFVPNMGLRPSN